MTNVTGKRKLPDSFTIVGTVLPPGQEEKLENVDLMTLIGRLNRANRKLQRVIRESGNGMRFRETRDDIYQDLAAGKEP